MKTLQDYKKEFENRFEVNTYDGGFLSKYGDIDEVAIWQFIEGMAGEMQGEYNKKLFELAESIYEQILNEQKGEEDEKAK